MGLDDTFEFDETAYARKIQQWDLDHLRKQEIVKNRQKISSGASITTGLGFATFTMGLSLVGSAYGGRRHYVAQKKLELIQAELKKRGIQKHELTGKDLLIGVLPSVITMGLGVGVDALATHATSTVAAHAVADHGSRAVQDAVQNPGTFMAGVEQGITLQAHEAGQLLHGGLQHASTVANIDSSYVVAGAPYVDPAQVVGLAAGISITKVFEAIIAEFAAGKIAVRLVNVATNKTSQAITFGQPKDSCRRIRSPPKTIACEHCFEVIDCNTTRYYRK